MTEDWNRYLEDPIFGLTADQIREYGLLEIWRVRDGSEEDKVRVRSKWLEQFRSYPGWNNRFWYAQRRAKRSNDPHQSPLVYPERDTNGMHGSIQSHPEIAKFFNDGGIWSVLREAQCTVSECDTMAMRFKGKTIREIAGELDRSSSEVGRSIVSGIDKLRARFLGQSVLNVLDDPMEFSDAVT